MGKKIRRSKANQTGHTGGSRNLPVTMQVERDNAARAAEEEAAAAERVRERAETTEVGPSEHPHRSESPSTLTERQRMAINWYRAKGALSYDWRMLRALPAEHPARSIREFGGWSIVPDTATTDNVLIRHRSGVEVLVYIRNLWIWNPFNLEVKALCPRRELYKYGAAYYEKVVIPEDGAFPETLTLMDLDLSKSIVPATMGGGVNAHVAVPYTTPL